MAAALHRQPKGKFIYTIPGNSEEDDNYFLQIGGNQGGGRVRFGVAALINITKWNNNLVEILKGPKKLGRGTFIPWCEDCDGKDENDIFNGFGRTDGKPAVVIPARVGHKD